MPDNSLANLPLTGLLERFASSEPIPGGGSAAALAGAVAASLAAMVARLTKDQPDFTEQPEWLEKADALRTRLSQAIDEDALAYEQVVLAFARPRQTPTEKQERTAAIQAALQGAAATPLAVAHHCLEVAQLAWRVLQKGNPNASSDAAVALLFALSGLEAALLNVAINLDSIKDPDYVAQNRAQLEQLLHQGHLLRTELWTFLPQRIRSLP
ncbi:cyclodeaminase/cyclohydrolase family protein [Gloeobacter kilaueensis]|uniref:Methenyltetrahydrofolate cyclohydrolase n=1 Tax=Gloeobacter kilaueensis (strain ATCC BAA-2537 / CCAP 1431/1 / ULC 316 / JS1) TaxID=1183438 RepID=U5QNG5_GLOK1|nr:cyclodeaminase/cyclohydrolase family protein [Gloeobacter kilaueensis]AGY60466.1 methenyltetrahydrofolate cyclohydrolase [Gloeobacter kilaueensis JS1]